MNRLVTLNHGSGGRQAAELISGVFLKSFAMEEPLTDSAILTTGETIFSFTTDSFIVEPLFFPGGDIGKLAVCGTVNDLAVSGAEPAYLSASFIIEEGFPVSDLESIARSMAEEAGKAGVKIVTGDTKVVEKGKCDKLFITTSGVGLLKHGREHISTGEFVAPGDSLIINGSLGNHSIAVLGVRNKLSFTAPVISDCASLNRITGAILENCRGVHFMRDLTRGGLAAILNELSGMTGYGMEIDEAAIPVDEPVRGICEMLGFDPLSLANEGKLLIVVDPEDERNALDILHAGTSGKEAAVIGKVMTGKPGQVILKTSAGGRRIIDMPSGALLPRIC